MDEADSLMGLLDSRNANGTAFRKYAMFGLMIAALLGFKYYKNLQAKRRGLRD
ncbi:hypothetical protein EV182_005284, partial [Spiromyces aspiralis]